MSVMFYTASPFCEQAVAQGSVAWRQARANRKLAPILAGDGAGASFRHIRTRPTLLIKRDHWQIGSVFQITVGAALWPTFLQVPQRLVWKWICWTILSNGENARKKPARLPMACGAPKPSASCSALRPRMKCSLSAPNSAAQVTNRSSDPSDRRSCGRPSSGSPAALGVWVPGRVAQTTVDDDVLIQVLLLVCCDNL